MEIRADADSEGIDFEVHLRNIVRKEIEHAIHPLYAPYSERIQAAFSGVTDANGRVGFRVYDVPDGHTFLLYKFIAWGDAHNPSTGGVYTNAAAYGGLYHGIAGAANLADFWPYPEAANGQVLPYTREYSDKNGPEFRQNDNVYFALVGGPANENITILLFGDLIDLKGRPGRAVRESQVPRKLSKRAPGYRQRMFRH